MRLTRERSLVANAVLQFAAPFSMEDLEAELGRRDAPRVSRASVYRTLSLMLGVRLLRELPGRERTQYVYVPALEPDADP